VEIVLIYGLMENLQRRRTGFVSYVIRAMKPMMILMNRKLLSKFT